ncbi:MAG: penicillin-binding protein activator [Rhodospirillaceae bacterium]|nr:penicillin-binding protein activator [Rhodospirillaceae bacterium]
MNRVTTIATLACLAALAGCSAQGPTLSTDLRALEERAQQLVAGGELEEAVGVYAQLIDASAGSTRSGFLAAGARVLLDMGDFGAARRWLLRARSGATPAQAQQLLVVLAEVDISEGRPDAALDTLERVSQPASGGLLAAVAAVRGRALFGLERVAEAVTTLVERERWLDAAQLLDNHRLIWAGLTGQPSAGPFAATGDPVIDGWLALQPIAVAARTDPFGLRESLARWRQAHPDHPAAHALVQALLAESRRSQDYPAQIAVLLPFSGLQQSVARVVRDGFIAAHLSSAAHADGGTILKFYDTTLLGPQEAYLRAQADGADFVVGPLLKPEVEAVIGSAGLIPTLALNSIETQRPVPSNLYQFALAPEDEAREVARHAVANGATHAVALIQNSDWGQRLLGSFRDELESLGGQLLQYRTYDSGSQDFSATITMLLNIERSDQRRQRLAANLGMALQFEPRRRQDVDLIFVAADASAGRLLVPQLRFHYAGDIPTYATSAVHESHARDSDHAVEV